MAAKTSPVILIFGVVNIVIALMASCSSCVTMTQMISNPRLEIEGRDVGPELNAHLKRKVPGITAMSILFMSGNAFCALSMLIGAVGLFLAKKWGRTSTVSAGLAFICIFCTADAYHLVLSMPAYNEFMEAQVRVLPEAERPGYKYGVLVTAFFWTCFNPILVIYLGVMTFYVSRISSQDKSRKRQRRDADDDNSDEPRPRRRRERDD